MCTAPTMNVHWSILGISPPRPTNVSDIKAAKTPQTSKPHAQAKMPGLPVSGRGGGAQFQRLPPSFAPSGVAFPSLRCRGKAATAREWVAAQLGPGALQSPTEAPQHPRDGWLLGKAGPRAELGPGVLLTRNSLRGSAT